MDKVLLAIKQLLDTAKNTDNSPLDDIKIVYKGDPVIIPETNMPAIAVQPINTRYTKRGSQYDQKDPVVQIRLIYNQKDYFGFSQGAAVVIDGATYADEVITFTTSTDHNLEVEDGVTVEDILPIGFNGTYKVIEIVSDTEFKVSQPTAPTAYVSGGNSYRSINDEVFAITDGISKVEPSTNSSTEDNSICGVIQKNYKLPLITDGTTVNTAVEANVTNVNYIFNQNRGFPTFEIITDVLIKVIGNR